MRVRKTMIASAMVTAAALSGASVAQAQGSAVVPVTSSVAVGTPHPPAGAVPEEHLFTPPAVLGQGWAEAVRAVIDGMKQLVDAERIEAADIGAASGPFATTTTAAPWGSAPVLPAWRARWLPASALRDAIARSPVQLTPVAAVPPTETTVDTRGEGALLLGARMELPWVLP